jgi:predicted nucleotidyltransferase
MEKVNRNEAVSILKRYITSALIKNEWYKHIKPYVKAIVFYGSTAKGLNRPDSDLDMLIFAPLKIEEEYTKGEYSYQFEGREVNIVLRSIERLRKLGKEQNDKLQAEVFRNSEILFETDSEVRKLIDKIKDVNEKQ